MQKTVVYTAIFGAKDKSRTDIKVFTEGDFDKFQSPVMNAKIFKLLPHKFIDCEISIWIDGNIYLNVPPEKLVDEFLGDSDMALLRHYRGKDIYWEKMMLGRTFRNRTPWVVDEVNKQIAHYEETGQIPNRSEMAMGGLIIRRHIPKVFQFNESWWAEVCRFSQRDQLSFPVVRKRFPELKVNLVRGNIKDHPYWHYIDHAHYQT